MTDNFENITNQDKLSGSGPTNPSGTTINDSNDVNMTDMTSVQPVNQAPAFKDPAVNAPTANQVPEGMHQGTSMDFFAQMNAVFEKQLETFKIHMEQQEQARLQREKAEQEQRARADAERDAKLNILMKRLNRNPPVDKINIPPGSPAAASLSKKSYAGIRRDRGSIPRRGAKCRIPLPIRHKMLKTSKNQKKKKGVAHHFSIIICGNDWSQIC